MDSLRGNKLQGFTVYHISRICDWKLL